MGQMVHLNEMKSPWKRHMASGFAALFDVGIRRIYSISIEGLEHFSGSPSTLVVSNHRRDSDGPIIASVLFQRHRLHSQGVRPDFIAREDLFRRGFLGEYLEHWPSPVRFCLAGINLGPLLTFMDAHPMRRVPERSLREVLEEVLELFGNLPLDEVLRPTCLVQFKRMAGDHKHPLRVKDVLSRRYRHLLLQRRGLYRLTLNRFRTLVPYERSVIESQLQALTHRINEGATLLLEPEGVVSVDGRFARLRGALHALLNRPQSTPRVLPVGITYDAMSEGRERIFVNIGPELTGLRGLTRRVSDARVSDAIRAQLTVTCSQIASQLLLEAGNNDRCSVTDHDLESYVSHQATWYASHGYHVDRRLLTVEGRKARLSGYVASCLRQGILLPDGDRQYTLRKSQENIQERLPESEAIIRYMNNELTTPVMDSLPSEGTLSVPGRTEQFG